MLCWIHEPCPFVCTLFSAIFQPTIFKFWILREDYLSSRSTAGFFRLGPSQIKVPYILGPEALFSPFWPPKDHIFFIYIQFPNVGCITWPFRFWNPNSVFGLWRLIFAFLTPKSLFFLTPCKIPDRRIIHTTILILGPKFRFLGSGGLFLPFWPLKVYIFFIYISTDRLTCFIFEPPSAQPRDPADFKLFWAKNTQHQITKYSAFLDFWNLA
jgi:hypothetical protein